mgnify:CR=1 FL=1
MCIRTAVFDLHDGQPIFTDGQIGAILLDRKFWHPFAYWDTGPDMQISELEDVGYITPTQAFRMAEKEFT